MYMKTFSVYGNFVESDMVGSPVHSPHFGAWSHLSQLLVSASVQVCVPLYKIKTYPEYICHALSFTWITESEAFKTRT